MSTASVFIFSGAIHREFQNQPVSLALSLQILLWMFLVLFCIMLIAVRAHYTADVFIAALMCIGSLTHSALQEAVWRLSCWSVGLRQPEKDWRIETEPLWKKSSELVCT